MSALHAIRCEPMHPVDEDGWCEWIHPTPSPGRGYLMQCCDCDLIHEMEFAIVPRDAEANAGALNDGEGETVIIFRARRHETDHPPYTDEEVTPFDLGVLALRRALDEGRDDVTALRLGRIAMGDAENVPPCPGPPA